MPSCTASYQGLTFLFISFSTASMTKSRHDICAVVNTLPGGGEALEFGAAMHRLWSMHTSEW